MKKIVFVFLLVLMVFVTACDEKPVDETPITCMEDEELIDGICKEKDEPIICEDNEELINGKCEIKTIVCDAPMELVDGVCTLQCIEHFEAQNGVCVRVSCPTDLILENGVCNEPLPHELELAIEETKTLENYELDVDINANDDISEMRILISENTGYISYLGSERFFTSADDVCYEYYYGSDVFVREEIPCNNELSMVSILKILDFEWFDVAEKYIVTENHLETLKEFIPGVQSFEVEIDDGYIEYIHYEILVLEETVTITIRIKNIDEVEIKIPPYKE